MNIPFDITEKKLLHNYHSAFYKLFHVPLDWVKPNLHNFTICGKEHCNPLCLRIMSSGQGAKLCADLERRSLETVLQTRKQVIHQCHAGFYDVTIPLFFGDHYLGSLCIGQYLPKKISEKQLEKVCRQLHFLKIDINELRNYYRHTRKFSQEEMSGMIELVQMIGEYICASYGRIQFMESIKGTDPIRAAELFIQKHYAKPLTVSAISRAVGLSESYFLHCFSAQTGLSPIQYLNRFRIEQAAELLIKSQLTIQEIAVVCGFGSVSMFIRHFKKIKGIAPRNYRLERQFSGSSNP